MINEKKIPDEIQPAKPNWRRRLLISALKSPISTILILAFLYFAFQAYVLQLSPTVNKFYIVRRFVSVGILVCGQKCL